MKNILEKKEIRSEKEDMVEFMVSNVLENIASGGKGLVITFNGKDIAVLSTIGSVEPVFHFVVDRKELLKLLNNK